MIIDSVDPPCAVHASISIRGHIRIRSRYSASVVVYQTPILQEIYLDSFLDFPRSDLHESLAFQWKPRKKAQLLRLVVGHTGQDWILVYSPLAQALLPGICLALPQ